MTTKLVAHDPKYKDTFSSLLDHADNSYAEIKRTMEAEGDTFEDEDEDDDETDAGLKGVFDEMADNIIAEDKRKKEAGEEDTTGASSIHSLMEQMTKLSAQTTQHLDPNENEKED